MIPVKMSASANNKAVALAMGEKAGSIITEELGNGV